MSDWSLRNISLLGKITVIKTLALPILVQCFTVLPDPPDHIIKSLQNIFYTFIWNGKTDKIKRSTLICDYSNGGLKMPHIQSFIHALKVSWIKKISDPMKGANIRPFRCIWQRKTLVSLSLRAKTISKEIQFFLARRHFTLCKYS